jgi:uncharacterized protein YndB with AHSA1/START domain
MPARTDALRDDELLITRTFKAPLSLVWRMWEDEDHMRHWWGPEGFTVLSLAADFRVGGAWRVHMMSKQWGESWSGGAFREIEPRQRIVFTFAWDEGSGETTETLVTVTFEEADGVTTLQHFHQTPFSSVESRDGHVAGWNSLFNKEEIYAAALALGETLPPLN